MFTTMIDSDTKPNMLVHEEGELYKVITTFGKTFELRYGYYGEKDRVNPLCDPVVIYPDFTAEPLYTENGEPFVTVVQDACDCYKGKNKRDPNTTCEECKFFQRGEDWFGICTCAKNRKPQNGKGGIQNE